jgi:hypothetical protein
MCGPQDDVWYTARCVKHAAGRGHMLRYTLDGEEEWVADLDKGGGAPPKLTTGGAVQLLNAVDP